MSDFKFEFNTTITSEGILAILKKHVDSHAMIDTLKLFDEYAGEC
jgi:hypothetical protein